MHIATLEGDHDALLGRGFLSRQVRKAKNVAKSTANFAERHATAVAVVAPAALPLLVATKKGRQNLFGQKSPLQQSTRFIARHPYASSLVIGPAATAAIALSQKKGRQTLFGKKSALQKTTRFIARHPYASTLATGGLALPVALAQHKGRKNLLSPFNNTPKGQNTAVDAAGKSLADQAATNPALNPDIPVTPDTPLQPVPAVSAIQAAAAAAASAAADTATAPADAAPDGADASDAAPNKGKGVLLLAAAGAAAFFLF